MVCPGGKGLPAFPACFVNERVRLTPHVLQMIEEDFDISLLVAQVLEESGFAESRASKMDVDDFLRFVRQLLFSLQA